MPKIDSSVVVITGASSGIGRATALRVAERGGTAVLIARQEKALKALAEECEHLGGSALVVPADVTELDQVRDCARQAIETFGRIDAWVNNAAVSLFARFEDAPMDDYRRVIETNLFGYIYGARAVLPYFREQGTGVLINVSSVVGKTGQPLTSAYTTSKFAIDGLSESLRMEMEDAPEIHVCTVYPPSIDTPLFQHAANFTGKKVQPMNPVYPAGDVAAAILKCIEKPRREISIGSVSKGMSLFRTVIPGLTEKAMAKAVPKEHLANQRARPSHGNLFKPLRTHNRVSGGWRDEDEAEESSGKEYIAAAALALAGLAGAGLAAWIVSRERKRFWEKPPARRDDREPVSITMRDRMRTPYGR